MPLSAPSPLSSQESLALGSSSASSSLKETCLLYSWVQHRASVYMGLLRMHLPYVSEGGNLASVMEHCMVSRVRLVLYNESRQLDIQHYASETLLCKMDSTCPVCQGMPSSLDAVWLHNLHQ